jgi:hypothetical protein
LLQIDAEIDTAAANACSSVVREMYPGSLMRLWRRSQSTIEKGRRNHVVQKLDRRGHHDDKASISNMSLGRTYFDFNGAGFIP